MLRLCSCGFATDDDDWFDGHLDEHPGHWQRRIVRDSPTPAARCRSCSPFVPESLAGVQRGGLRRTPQCVR